MQKNIERKGLVFKLNPFELVAIESRYHGENTWHRQLTG